MMGGGEDRGEELHKGGSLIPSLDRKRGVSGSASPDESKETPIWEVVDVSCGPPAGLRSGRTVRAGDVGSFEASTSDSCFKTSSE